MFDSSSRTREAGNYQCDDPLAIEAVGQEHWLEYAIWPLGERNEHVVGLGSKPAIGSAHRR
jgi:hypothetical protein